MITTDKPSFLFRDGKFYKVSAAELADTGGIIGRMAGSVPVRVYNPAPGIGHLSISSGLVLGMMRVSSISLRTGWTAVSADEPDPAPGTGLLAPSFRPPDLQLSPVFALPSVLDVRLGVVLTWNGEAGYWEWNACHFAVRLTGVAGFFLLPLPNVYDDSSVCMGANFTMRGPDLVGLLASVRDRFTTAPWNADLLGDRRANARRMFRVALPAGGGDPQPVSISNTVRELQPLLKPVSHPMLAQLY